MPTIETDWVPPSKQSQIGATFTKIAKPTLQCMFEPRRSRVSSPNARHVADTVRLDMRATVERNGRGPEWPATFALGETNAAGTGVAVPCVLLALAFPAAAAPDEELLGKSAGYPIGTRANWFFDEGVRVGSFSHLDQHTAALYACESATPLPLAKQPARRRSNTGSKTRR